MQRSKAGRCADGNKHAKSSLSSLYARRHSFSPVQFPGWNARLFSRVECQMPGQRVSAPEASLEEGQEQRHESHEPCLRCCCWKSGPRRAFSLSRCGRHAQRATATRLELKAETIEACFHSTQTLRHSIPPCFPRQTLSFAFRGRVLPFLHVFPFTHIHIRIPFRHHTSSHYSTLYTPLVGNTQQTHHYVLAHTPGAPSLAHEKHGKRDRRGGTARGLPALAPVWHSGTQSSQRASSRSQSITLENTTSPSLPPTASPP